MSSLDQTSINFINTLLKDSQNLIEASITHNYPESNYSTIIIKAKIPNTSNIPLERGINISPFTSSIPNNIISDITTANQNLIKQNQ
jgi:hypothetical protein